MKRSKITTLILSIGMLFSSISCSDFLDVNTDPNNPTEVSEPLLLTGILANFSYEVIGGYPVRVTNTWIKQTTYNAVLPHYDNYQVTESDVNNLWTFYAYPQIMQNCKVLVEKATASNARNYSAIARIIWAWQLSIVADLYNNVPYSQALQPEVFPQPKYDSQEEVYGAIQTLLDEAIADIDATDKNLAITPLTDDFIFGGAMAKWRRVAYTLKARFHLRLTYAPNHTPATQAQLALTAVANGIQVLADDAKFPYLKDPGQENPWFQYAIDGKWDLDTQISNYYITLLQGLDDPRIHSQAKLVGGIYQGHENGTPAEADLSAIGAFYSAADAPLEFLSAVESKFIIAEANFILGNRAAAETALEEGLTLSFNKQRTAIHTGAAAANAANTPAVMDAKITAYIATNKLLPADDADAYEHLMTQKYISNFLQFETYNDWRRTGYPEVAPVANPFPDNLTTVPLRFPYPAAELTYNSANVNAENIPIGFRGLGNKVWWNSCDDCCTICGEK
jgi:hypothetical protein